MFPSLSASLFWVATIVCLAAQIAVLRSSFLGRTPGASSSGKTGTREITWAVLPALMLVATLFFTWRAVDSRNSDRSLDEATSREAFSLARPALSSLLPAPQLSLL